MDKSLLRLRGEAEVSLQPHSPSPARTGSAAKAPTMLTASLDNLGYPVCNDSVRPAPLEWAEHGGVRAELKLAETTSCEGKHMLCACRKRYQEMPWKGRTPNIGLGLNGKL